MAQMTALRRRMIDDMTVRNLSPATQQSYVYAVAKFSRFFACSPDRLGVGEVRAYQLHLAGLGWSWSHINQVSCALRFFFGVTLGRPEAFDRIISAKEPKKLPVVLSGEESPFPSGGAGAAQPGGSDHSLWRGCARWPPSRLATSTAAAWSSGSSTARAARTAATVPLTVRPTPAI
jgi:hypothetical protein